MINLPFGMFRPGLFPESCQSMDTALMALISCAAICTFTTCLTSCKKHVFEMTHDYLGIFFFFFSRKFCMVIYSHLWLRRVSRWTQYIHGSDQLTCAVT